jgi:hypothetical protein
MTVRTRTVTLRISAAARLFTEILRGPDSTTQTVRSAKEHVVQSSLSLALQRSLRGRSDGWWDVTHGAYRRGSVPDRQDEPDARRGPPRAIVTERSGPENYGSEFQEFLRHQQLGGFEEAEEFPESSGWASVGQHAAGRPGRQRIGDPHRSLADTLRNHKLFVSLLAVATVIRLIAMLGYQPGLWYADSLAYVADAVHLYPDVTRPDGYPFFLYILMSFHSITLVVGLQHILGLGIGVAVYALLRHRYRLPAWAATLAAAPALLSIYAIQIEHYVLSDTLFAALITLVLTLVLWRPQPSLKVCALAGLLLGAAAIVRSQGIPMFIPFVIYLVMRFNRRAVVGLALMIAMFAAPIGGYVYWYHKHYGTYNLTSSTGAFLFGRVATFAECSIIKPPADERFLCLNTPLSQRQGQGTNLVWSSESPLMHGPFPEFSNETDKLATNFAIRTIEAQPGAYLRAIWGSTLMAFEWNRPNTPEGQSQSYYMFLPHTPISIRTLVASCTASCYDESYAYNGGRDPSTRLVQPFADLILAYQRIAIVPGPLLGLIVLAGMAGVGLTWRRLGNPVLLPWLVGVLIIVTPAATALFDARYLVAAIPSLSVAAALGVQEIIMAWRRRSHAGADVDPALAG